MGAKRNNHEVARSFLRRWRHPVPDTTDKLWALDVRTSTIEERSLEATFAIGRFIYVPRVNGKRDDRMEDWFGEAEQALSEFLERVDGGRLDQIDPKQHTRIVFALAGLAVRSEYEVRRLQAAVAEREDLRSGMALATDDEDSIHLAVVDNLINHVTMIAESLAGRTLQVALDCDDEPLVCDRPAVYSPKLATLLVPLGPRSFCVIDGRAQLGPAAMTFPGRGRTAELVQQLNRWTVERARRWVVAATRPQLETIRQAYTPELLARREAADAITVTPVSEEERARLWSFPRA
ncbi:MAG: DUF4238 domain-containing protein [Myxococcota bacterium]